MANVDIFNKWSLNEDNLKNKSLFLAQILSLNNAKSPPSKLCLDHDSGFL